MKQHKININLLPIINISELYSKKDMMKVLGIKVSNSGYKKINNYIQLHNLDISHFSTGAKNIKYQIINKECPICKKVFLAKRGEPKELTTCGKSCANKYFRTGENHPNYKLDGNSYRAKCFKTHKKQCVVCGEDKAVAVHHYDGNHSNNNIENLIPLCPTHHVYIHTKKLKPLIEGIVNTYVTNFKIQQLVA